jgi:hypothetical protein
VRLGPFQGERDEGNIVNAILKGNRQTFCWGQSRRFVCEIRRVCLSSETCRKPARGHVIVVHAANSRNDLRTGTPRLEALRAVQRYLRYSPGSELRCRVSTLGHGVGWIEAKDIVGEAAQPGEDPRGAANARSVFAEGDVAGVMRQVESGGAKGAVQDRRRPNRQRPPGQICDGIGISV